MNPEPLAPWIMPTIVGGIVFICTSLVWVIIATWLAGRGIGRTTELALLPRECVFTVIMQIEHAEGYLAVIRKEDESVPGDECMMSVWSGDDLPYRFRLRETGPLDYVIEDLSDEADDDRRPVFNVDLDGRRA
jgi:hypothetical protein